MTQLGLLALDRQNAAVARSLLTESLTQRWITGQRGAAAETLEALAEAMWQLGAVDEGGKLLQTANLLREETGLAHQPVYAPRHERVRSALSGHLPSPESVDIDAVVGAVIGQTNRIPRLTA
jgi:hypothetical protein